MVSTQTGRKLKEKGSSLRNRESRNANQTQPKTTRTTRSTARQPNPDPGRAEATAVRPAVSNTEVRIRPPQQPEEGEGRSPRGRKRSLENNSTALPRDKHARPGLELHNEEGRNGTELSIRDPSPLISDATGGLENDSIHDAEDVENNSTPLLLSHRNRRSNNYRPTGTGNTANQSSSPTPAESRSRSNNRSDRDSLLPTFNQIKTQLLEVQRDKRVYASTVLTQNDKIMRLEKELQHKNMQILGLEESLARKGANRTRKGNIWSQQRLGNDGIAEYQGVCLALGRLGSSQVNYLVTESFLDSSDEQLRRRDWRGSATNVSAVVANQSFQCVQFPEGTLGIPTCVMVRALEMKFFNNVFHNPSGFLRECLKKVLSSPAASFMTETEKKLCESKVASHRPTNQKFRAMISDAVGNRKKISRNTYLRSLGYNNAVKPVSRNDSTDLKELRTSEKERIANRCVTLLESGYPDTSYWRTTDWKILCFDETDPGTSKEMEQAEEEFESGKGVDCWFMNEASRRAFLELKGYPALEIGDRFFNDASILALARADASLTTMLKLVTVGGRGGVRNNAFIESFRTLLPLAMELIIKDLWMDISNRAEHELRPFIGNSEENEDDPYGNCLRDYTVVQLDPHDNHVYVLASAKYIQEKICSWIGSIKDAHIGRCKKGERLFTMIDKHMNFEENELSDVDTLPHEEIPRSDMEHEGTPSVQHEDGTNSNRNGDNSVPGDDEVPERN